MTLLNALTPVTFIAMYQLVLGNLFLGVLESFLIRKIFKLSPNYAIIIIANYISAVIGFLIAANLLDPTELNMIRAYHNGTFPLSMFSYTGIGFFATLAVEFPFYYLGIRSYNKEKLPIHMILKILFVAHIFSYLVTIATWLIFVR